MLKDVASIILIFILANGVKPWSRKIITSSLIIILDYDQHLQQLKYEPSEALTGGPDGLCSIKTNIKEAKSYLTDGGWLLLEHGFDQSQKIIELLQKAHYHHIQVHTDLAGLPRMIVARG